MLLNLIEINNKAPMDSQKVYGGIRRLSAENRLLRKQRNDAWDMLEKMRFDCKNACDMLEKMTFDCTEAWGELDCTITELMAAKKELARVKEMNSAAKRELAMVNAMNSAAKRELDREMAALLRSRAELHSAHLANAELQRKVNRLSNELEVAYSRRNIALATAHNATVARNFAVVAFATVCVKPVDATRTKHDSVIVDRDSAIVDRDSANVSTVTANAFFIMHQSPTKLRSVQLMICAIICVMIAVGSFF
jgi:uncharacterized protein (DUF3084 family)